MNLFPEVAHLFVNPVLDNVYIDLDVQEQIRTAGQNSREQRHLLQTQQHLAKSEEVSGRMLERQIQSIRNTIIDIGSKTRNLRSVEVGHKRSHDDLCASNHSCVRIPTQTLRINPNETSKESPRLDPYDMHTLRMTSTRKNVKVTRSKSLPPLKNHTIQAGHSWSKTKPMGSPNILSPSTQPHVVTNYPYVGLSLPRVNNSPHSPTMYNPHPVDPRLTYNTPIPHVDRPLPLPQNHRHLLPALTDSSTTSRDLSHDDVTKLPSMNRRRTIRRADVIHQSLKALYHQRKKHQRVAPKK